MRNDNALNIAAIYTIEYQKRGLPHAHILLWLHADYKISSNEEIDKIISAEIPNLDEDPVGYSAVAEYMLHGPCGSAFRESPCMNRQTNCCSKHFPKSFISETKIDDYGFPIYRRRDVPERYVEKKGVKLDNRFVVPYNLDLIIKYQAHINVEWCNKSKSIKYLFKYINKGPDRVTMLIEDNISGCMNENADGNIIEIDEIKTYLDCRYVSPIEASWRIFQFDIHFRDPSVERLSFHLPDEQPITFKDNDYLDNVLRIPSIEKTMFTEWMRANANFAEAQELTYSEFPIKFVWVQRDKKWKLRKSGRCVGRIYSAHPSSGEKFYLRMLLNIVRGPHNYEDIKTINGVTYPTFKAACYALGLLDDDKEWNDCLQEASNWATGYQLRQLFVTLLLYCEVSDPLQLWENNWELLADDISYRLRKLFNHQSLVLSDIQLKNYTLVEIENLLLNSGMSLNKYPNMPLPDDVLLQECNNRLIQEETNYNRESLKIEHCTLYQGLNQKQREIYDVVIGSVSENKGHLFFVYGHGGTGKTYLWKTICAKLRSEGKIVIAVASSGIAALLLPGGRTAHSRFKIPIDLKENSVCEIHQGTQLAELMQKASLIIWDEAPMDHRYAFEAVDRTLRDILRFDTENCEEKPFGGKTVLLGGDFRQILPVVPHGTREDVLQASLNRSLLWKYCKIFKLTENMRLQQCKMTLDEQESIKHFGKWILNVGEGKIKTIAFGEEVEPSWIKVPNDFLLTIQKDSVETIVDSTYPEFYKNFSDEDYLQERAILTPHNETVDIVNNYLLQRVGGEKKIYLSSDSICKSSSGSVDQEVLYPTEYLNSLTFPGIPNHQLDLKAGVPIMLLRNINQSMGLCNGTRLIITQLAKWVIEGKIITGTNKGTKVFIPRIIMSPSETKLPFILKRRQFPVRLCFAMTINKSQGQTLQCVGLYLRKPVFTHGQLYVAVSRVTSKTGLKICIENDGEEHDYCTKNIVYKEAFNML